MSLHGRQTPQGLRSPFSALYDAYYACENPSYLGHLFTFSYSIIQRNCSTASSDLGIHSSNNTMLNQTDIITVTQDSVEIQAKRSHRSQLHRPVNNIALRLERT